MFMVEMPKLSGKRKGRFTYHARKVLMMVQSDDELQSDNELPTPAARNDSVIPETYSSSSFFASNNFSSANNSSTVLTNDTLEVNDTENSNLNILNELRIWAVEENISHSSLNRLLRILKSCLNLDIIPCDSRTLLKTIRKISSVQKVPPGAYYHFGVQNCIEKIYNAYNILPDCNLDIAVNIDGLPISKSSGLANFRKNRLRKAIF